MAKDSKDRAPGRKKLKPSARVLAPISAFLLICWLAPPAAAHHAQPEYNRTIESTVIGTVAEFQMINPHSWMRLTVEDSGGTAEEWFFEAGSVGRLSEAGWERDDFKPGDRVTVLYSPRRDGEPGGILRGVTAPDGKFYSARGRIQSRVGSGRP